MASLNSRMRESMICVCGEFKLKETMIIVASIYGITVQFPFC